MTQVLFAAAVIPVIALCTFIYLKDKNRESIKLLALLFGMGFLSVFPILICELLFGLLFPMHVERGFFSIFLNVFFGVALFEEGFKWINTKLLGFNNKEFDEIYDIIVYSVFASLGFACFENIVYVFQYGLVNAFNRALLAVPGHTCFAITMGYFLSKAKVGQINGNRRVYLKNIIYSIIVPMGLHTLYDTFLFNASTDAIQGIISLVPFFVFDFAMVGVCFIIVNQTAKIQQNLIFHIKEGNFIKDEAGFLYYNYKNNISNLSAVKVISSIEQSSVSTSEIFPNRELLFCPICGKSIRGHNYCGSCGFKVK